MYQSSVARVFRDPASHLMRRFRVRAHQHHSMKRGGASLAYALLCVSMTHLVDPLPAHGVTTRIDFVAVIDVVNDVICQCIPPTAVTAGDTLVGYYVFDSSCPDTDPGSSSGLYAYTTSPFGILVHHPNYDWGTDLTSVNFKITVANDVSFAGGVEDRYIVNSYHNLPDSFMGLPLSLIRIELFDGTGTALSGDYLPSSINLADWPTERYLDVWGYQAEWSIRAVIVSMTTEPTGVGDVRVVNGSLRVCPNPFNPQTTISFSLSEGGHVTLAVYDVAGRKVRALVNEHQASGTYRIGWDGTDDHGARVASGIYVCRLMVGSFVETRKMALLK